MQHSFLHTIEVETVDRRYVPGIFGSLPEWKNVPVFHETALTITYEYTPPSRGQKGPHGEPLEPDAESEIEILSATDEAGNECDPETIENINALSLCWDHLAKTFEQ